MSVLCESLFCGGGGVPLFVTLLVTGVVDTGNEGGRLFTDDADDDDGDGVVGCPDVDGPGLVPNTSNRARRFLRISSWLSSLIVTNLLPRIEDQFDYL